MPFSCFTRVIPLSNHFLEQLNRLNCLYIISRVHRSSLCKKHQNRIFIRIVRTLRKKALFRRSFVIIALFKGSFVMIALFRSSFATYGYIESLKQTHVSSPSVLFLGTYLTAENIQLAVFHNDAAQSMVILMIIKEEHISQ